MQGSRWIVLRIVSAMMDWERSWLDYAYDMMRDANFACTCEPYSNGEIRWPGYVGSSYRGVLLVGARHNVAGLRKAGLNAGPLRRYVEELRRWTASARVENTDRRVLEAMRSAYRHAYPIWAKPGSVWGIFDLIRGHMGLTWDDVASVNLARCYEPETRTGEDDAHIRSHARMWPLDRIVKQLKPKLVFVAKDSDSLRDVLSITSDGANMPHVIRYSNHGTGKRRNDGYASEWVPRDAATWRELIA